MAHHDSDYKLGETDDLIGGDKHKQRDWLLAKARWKRLRGRGWNLGVENSFCSRDGYEPFLLHYGLF